MFFRELGRLFLIFKKGRVDLFPLVGRLYWSDDNTTKFNAWHLFVSNAKMNSNYCSSELTSSFFFFYVRNRLLRVFIYLIYFLIYLLYFFIYLPFESIFLLLLLLYCSNLLSISSSIRSLDFNERIWCCITFFQLEGRCSNCNHFYQPYKTKGCKCKNQAA